MTLSIMSNAASLSILKQLDKTNNSLATALARLGSGYRINSSKDDAAGLQIANRLTAQATGQSAALYNANNAMTMLQTADSAFDEMSSIANRMKELATQAANGTNESSEYSAMDSEYQALKAELESVMKNTSYGAGTKLLSDGKFSKAVMFQVGASKNETLKVNLGDKITAIDSSIIAAGGLKVASGTAADSQALAQTAIGNIDGLISSIGAARSTLGASMNRLEHTINNVTNMQEATKIAASNLMDTNYALESSNMTKQQLLMNSGISVLSVSNSTAQIIASLLGK